MTFTVKGLDELVADMTAASVRAKLGAVEAARRTASKVERTAKTLAPKGPVPHGDVDLAPSIHTTQIGSAFEVGPSARHGIFMELGTWKDAPQPFLFPAAERHAREFVAEMERLGEF